MRKSLLLTAFLLLISTVTFAQKSGFGIGVIVGEPTGISAKKFLSNTTAIDAAAAWSFKDEAALHIHADYLFHDYSLIKSREGRIPFYYGIGGRIKLADDPLVGIRIPVGIAYEFEGAPVDIFVEVVPLLDLVPETEFDFNAALGVRFYVK